MFERSYIVDAQDIDEHGYLSMPVLARYLNDIMELNAESYGAGADYHLAQNLAWVLVEYQIDIQRLPGEDEIITVGTLPYAFKRMMGYRKYRILDEVGNPLIKGKGKFMLINLSSKEIVRPSRELLEKFTDAKIGETLPFPKWKVDNKRELSRHDYKVNAADIDVNGHVNNASYIRMLCDAFSDTVPFHKTEKLFVKYKKEAFEGDALTFRLYSCDQGYYSTIEKNDDIVTEALFQALER